MEKTELKDYLQKKGLNLDMTAHVMSKLLARYELFKKIMLLPGDIVECGVYRGATLFAWANLLEIFAPTSPKLVIGFDTFRGFSDHHKFDYDKASSEWLEKESGKFFPRSKEELYEIAEKLNLRHRIVLVEGDASKTIPKFIKEKPGFRACLMNLDFDVYDPTYVAIEHVYPVLVIGGIIASDQFGAHEWGESAALDDFFHPRGMILQSIPWASSPHAYFVKEHTAKHKSQDDFIR